MIEQRSHAIGAPTALIRPTMTRNTANDGPTEETAPVHNPLYTLRRSKPIASAAFSDRRM